VTGFGGSIARVKTARSSKQQGLTRHKAAARLVKSSTRAVVAACRQDAAGRNRKLLLLLLLSRDAFVVAMPSHAVPGPQCKASVRKHWHGPVTGCHTLRSEARWAPEGSAILAEDAAVHTKYIHVGMPRVP